MSDLPLYSNKYFESKKTIFNILKKLQKKKNFLK